MELVAETAMHVILASPVVVATVVDRNATATAATPRESRSVATDRLHHALAVEVRHFAVDAAA